LAGVFDLEPAMVGAPTYDWGALSIFIARGDASVLAAAVAGYDGGIDAGDPAWRSAVLAQILLHRYCNIPHHLGLQAVNDPADISELRDLLVPSLQR
jgi:hygromycin-B 7''-O-kinase